MALTITKDQYREASIPSRCQAEWGADKRFFTRQSLRDMGTALRDVCGNVTNANRVFKVFSKTVECTEVFLPTGLRPAAKLVSDSRQFSNALDRNTKALDFLARDAEAPPKSEPLMYVLAWIGPICLFTFTTMALVTFMEKKNLFSLGRHSCWFGKVGMYGGAAGSTVASMQGFVNADFAQRRVLNKQRELLAADPKSAGKIQAEIKSLQYRDFDETWSGIRYGMEAVASMLTIMGLSRVSMSVGLVAAWTALVIQTGSKTHRKVNADHERRGLQHFNSQFAVA